MSLSVNHALRFVVFASPTPGGFQGIENPVTSKSPNESFLRSVFNKTELQFKPFYEEVFNPSFAKQKRKEFEGKYLEFEIKERYQLVDYYDQKSHVDDLNQFTKNTLTETKNFHLQKKVSQASLGLKHSFFENQTFKSFHEPAALMLAVAAFSFGSPLNLKVTKNTSLYARTEVMKKKGELRFTSPLINTSMNFISLAPRNRDPYLSPTDDPVQKEERYKFSVDRGLGIWDLQSSLSYWTTTSTFLTSVRKQLHPNLACVVDSSRILKYSQNGLNGEETVRLLYGLDF